MFPAAVAKMAGPGQMPVKPHPRPNNDAPNMSCPSIAVLVGMEKWWHMIGVVSVFSLLIMDQSLMN